MKTFFHIGYPKAASSALQKGFFDQHPDLNFLGRIPLKNIGNEKIEIRENSRFLQSKELQEFHDLLVSIDKFSLEREKNTLAHHIDSEKVNVLSSEFVTSTFFSHSDIKQKLKRIKELGISNLIIVIRNQKDIIKSQYRDHPFDPADLVHGASVSLDQWVHRASKIPDGFLDSIKYDEIIAYCEELYQKKNILLLLFEDIISNPTTTALKISSFLSIDKEKSTDLLNNLPAENSGVSANYNKVRKLKKQLLGELPIKNYLPEFFAFWAGKMLKKGRKASYDYSPETVSYLNELYNETNNKLNDLYGLNVKKYNYPYLRQNP